MPEKTTQKKSHKKLDKNGHKYCRIEIIYKQDVQSNITHTEQQVYAGKYWFLPYLSNVAERSISTVFMIFVYTG